MNLKPIILLFFLCSTTLLFGQETYLDQFGSNSYAINDGTQNWAGNWIEANDDNNPGGGFIRIIGGELRFSFIFANLENIRRTADLTGASDATLSFDWRTSGLEIGENLSVQISNDGITYTTLFTINGSASGTDSGFFTQDVSAFISANTTVRVINLGPNWSFSNDIVFLDNIQISANFPPPSPTIAINNVNVDEADGLMTFDVEHIGLDAAGPFTVTYQTVDVSTTAGIDYNPIIGGTLNFNGTTGDTQQITITILDDGLAEALETLNIQFTAVSDPGVTITDVGVGTINSEIQSNVPLTLFNEFNGYYDYAITGGSLRTSDTNLCDITTTSSNTLTTTVPGTAQIERAYLFWTHSNANPDLQVTFEGQTVNAAYANQASIGTLTFYSMIGDVTDLVGGIANLSTNTFDFTGLDVDNGDPYCSSNVVLGGWSLLVFYTDDSLPAVSINLYQGFDGEQNSTTSFTLDGFFAIGATGAKTTVMSWEGDVGLANNELLSLTTTSGTTTLSGDGDNNGTTVNNPFNSTLYDDTTPTITDQVTLGLDLDTYDISALISAGESTATTNVGVGGDFVLLNAVLLKVPSNLIVGTVFEDVNYGGGAGRDQATSGGLGLEGVMVELYDNAGNFEESITSDATGEYSFGGMANGSYSVRVANTTIRSNRGGGTACTSCLPIQTYRRNFTTGVGMDDITDEIGGADPTATDVGTGVLTNAQTISTVSILSEGVVDLDFGFNFNTIVNTNNDGQGSLEQFIINSNGLDETGLDIEANAIFDPAAGEDTSIFMIPPSGDLLGRTADANFTSGYFDILIPNSNPLTAINGTNTIVDGRTQTAYSGNTNSGTVGAGGSTVGVNAIALPDFDRPEIQLHKNNGDVLNLEGTNAQIRNIALYANNNAGIRMNSGSAIISNNLLGVNALGVNAGNIDFGVEILGGAVTVDGNYIATNTEAGILIDGGTASTIQNNQISDNGDDSCDDNITLADGSGVVIQRNLIENAASLGIDGDAFPGSASILENTIINSGQDGGNCSGNVENSGILLDGNNSTVAENIISTNGGAGIVLGNGNFTGNRISQNSMFANGGLGIDIDQSGEIGDGVTLNDNGDGDNGPNGSLNFPIINVAYTSGSNLIVRGWARPGATVEVFLTDINQGTASEGDNRFGFLVDYGEGQLYLGSAVEGSGADTDTGTSLYTDVDGNTDNTNRFEFAIPIPSGVAVGDMVTATATIANSTSEFSPFSTIIVRTIITNRRITYRVNGE
ncbi:beta strand repeat-containing protein [Spongiimicrobium salis]|uniref:beta strand repeat-containing protein n=1 Tax=Spongiimicrobium salis TaxID=1667022 RepID=UPI00374DE60B